MTIKQNIASKRPFWYFLSRIEHSTERLKQLIANECWEYYEDKVKGDYEKKLYLSYLKDMQTEDKVAIYNIMSESRDEFKQKHQYDIEQRNITYIMIKAIGEIAKPYNDNKIIEMNCQKVNDSRKWYRYTYRAQIWKVLPKNKKRWGENLIDFTFNGANQDLTRLKDELTKK